MHGSIDQVKALASSPQVSMRFDGRCTIVWLKVLTSQDCGPGKVCVRSEDKRESARGQPGRDRVVISVHPRAPARLRVGGLEWRRLFGSRRLGDPAYGSEARQLGQAQKRVRGNGLSCGRYGGRPSGNRIGCRLLEAHVDERMTSALEALDPADPTIGRLRALRSR